MKKDINCLICLCISCVLFFSACSKSSSSSSSTSSQLVGTWTIVRLGEDTNHSGNPVWFTASSLGISGYIKFNSNNTGIHSIVNPNDSPVIQTSPFTWSLSSDSKYVLATDSGKTGADGLHIDSLTSNSLVLKDTSGGSTTWFSATK